MLELLMRVRPEIRDRVSPQPKRAEFLARILDDQEIWDVLRSEGVDPAFHLAMRKGGLE